MVISILDAALLAAAGQVPIGPCQVVDGDTLRCGEKRIRLLGIDAPERGKCRVGRKCSPRDPYASQRSLAAATTGKLTIKRVGTDRYGRTLARVRGSKGDLSCLQLRKRQAMYRRD
ncbi:thermonuclease family protein [Sphingomonas sp.]|uniref:thermonuclease family protein n=1 Tax=Sphingomonas sp. TaxID=28214 RepID=UPI002E102605|nr:thermonuclease family protein [Sphingomonas sp.]